MGLTGLAVAWRLACARYGGPPWLSSAAPVIVIGGLLARTLLGLARGELRTLSA